MTRLLFLPLVLLSIGVCAQRRSFKEKEDNGEDKKARKEEKGAVIQTSEKKHPELVMLFMDGEYEKCFKKAVKATEDEETSKDPQPYLYASMSMYEQWILDESRQMWIDGLKDALKWAAKYRKKDEKSSQKQGLTYLEFWDDNKDYFGKLRKTSKEQAQFMLDSNKVNKAEAWYKQILLFDPGDYSTSYMLGTLRLEAKDTAQGNGYLRAYEIELGKVKESIELEPEDKIKLLKYGHVEYAKFLINENRTDLAKEVMKELITLVGKDEEIEKFMTEKGL